MARRKPRRPQIEVTEEMRIEIRGAIAEIDPAQMAIIARMTPAQRAAQGFAMSQAALATAGWQLKARDPRLSDLEARRLALQGYYERNPTVGVPR